MEMKFELLPPAMPNFVRFKTEPGLRQDGFNPLGGIPVEKFTRQEAEEYAELMKQEFIKHWERKQTHKKD